FAATWVMYRVRCGLHPAIVAAVDQRLPTVASGCRELGERVTLNSNLLQVIKERFLVNNLLIQDNSLQLVIDDEACEVGQQYSGWEGAIRNPCNWCLQEMRRFLGRFDSVTPLTPFCRSQDELIPCGSCRPWTWISPTVFQCKFQQKIRLGKSSASRL